MHQLVAAALAGLMVGVQVEPIPHPVVAAVAAELRMCGKVAMGSIIESLLLVAAAQLPAPELVAAMVVIQMDYLAAVIRQEMEKVAHKLLVALVALDSMVETLERLEPLGLAALAAPLPWALAAVVGAVGTMAVVGAGLMPIHLLLMATVVVAAGRGLSFPRPQIFPSHQACFLSAMGGW
jgi:hypothetical protein